MDGEVQSELQDREWRRLLETIRRGHCVLVMGPDAAVAPSSEEPLTLLLARHLNQQLAAEPSAGSSDDLALQAQLFLSQPASDRYDLELEIESFYQPYADQTSALHSDLSALPFQLCLTTTADRFLANAFDAQPGKSPTTAFYNFRRPGQQAALAVATADQPIVYALFGCLDALESLVISESDLLDFLLNVVRGSSGLPAQVQGQLADPATSFLFVGFGLQRWYARLLLHALKTEGHRNRSLALEGAAFFDHPDRARTAVLFQQTHSIAFCCDAMPFFAAELSRRYQAMMPDRSSVQPIEPPPGSPKVFLCHDSRDREAVIEIAHRLHALGVDTWRDQQNLRSGENWDRRIEQVITKQVDYVLVLESPRMLERVESYLNKEIHESLQRQTLFAAGETFVLPATLEACAGDPRLDHLHRADVSDPSGVDKLAEEIVSDWQCRQQRIAGAST